MDKLLELELSFNKMKKEIDNLNKIDASKLSTPIPTLIVK